MPGIVVALVFRRKQASKFVLIRGYTIECFTHVASIYANLLKQKKSFAYERSSIPTGLVWDTNMAAVSLFWDTNMAAVTSCENTLLNRLIHWSLRLSYKVLRPKLTKQCLHDLSGAIMESALFCTRSLRQSGRLWWKMGEQYSSTDLITLQWKSTISLQLTLKQKNTNAYLRF